MGFKGQAHAAPGALIPWQLQLFMEYCDQVGFRALLNQFRVLGLWVCDWGEDAQAAQGPLIPWQLQFIMEYCAQVCFRALLNHIRALGFKQQVGFKRQVHVSPARALILRQLQLIVDESN